MKSNVDSRMTCGRGRRGGSLTGRQMRSRAAVALAGAVVMLFGLQLVGAVGALADAGEPCPNAAVRAGYSAALPGCRAYELVSPPEIEPFLEVSGTLGNLTEGGQRLTGGAWGVAAAADGKHLGFFSLYAPEDAASDGPYYVASRTADGWATENAIPPQSVTNTGRTCFNAYISAYSPDFSKRVMADGDGQQEGSNCGTDEPKLVPGEPEGFQNLFLSGGAAGPYELLNLTPLGGSPANAWFQSASTDLSRVAFDTEAKLTADAEPGDNLYLSAGREVRLVTVLPDGTPAQGTMANGDLPASVFVGPGSEVYTHAMSSDGARIFFVVGGNLYVRLNGDREQSAIDGEGHCTEPAKACTVQVDASQAGGPGGGGTFRWASVDGSVVFFTDDASAELTGDTVPGSGQNLYQFNVSTGTLTDLTVAGEAEVLGVSGTSEDGSYAYFVARGELAAGATAGEPNLFVTHGAGAPKFVATLDGGNDALAWDPIYDTSRVSSSGAYIAFNSVRSLTGYDNTDQVSGEPDQEVYRYGAAGESLVCASCDPDGARPTAPTRLHQPAYNLLFELTPSRPQRNLSDDGQVFFDTINSVIPRDTNGRSDVYEYADGAVNLISTGVASVPSYFYEASSNGDDVFFTTSQQLVPGDVDAGVSVYDARVDGGFASSIPVPPCSGDSCKAPPLSPAGPPTIASGSSSVSGNLTPPSPVGTLTLVRFGHITLRGGKLAVKVTVPAAGRIKLSGSGTKALSRRFAKAGSYTISVELSAKGRVAVRKHRGGKGKARLTLRMSFVAASGQASSAKTVLTVKR